MRAQSFLFGALAALPFAYAQSSVTTVTTAASPSSSAGVFPNCELAFLSPFPTFYICGGAGSMTKPSIINSTTADSAFECGTFCAANPKCRTFGYSAVGNGTCTLSNKSFPQQGFVAGASGSGSGNSMQYYNVHCLGCAATATKTPKSTPSPTATGHGRCAQTSVVSNQQTYLRYYMGPGKTEDMNNPGNDNSQQPAISTTLTGQLWNDCMAIQACADIASQRAFVYYSFDVHWMSDTQQWSCVQFYDPNRNPAWFNVTNKNAYVAYGYYNPDY